MLGPLCCGQANVFTCSQDECFCIDGLKRGKPVLGQVDEHPFKGAQIICIQMRKKAASGANRQMALLNVVLYLCLPWIQAASAAPEPTPYITLSPVKRCLLFYTSAYSYIPWSEFTPADGTGTKLHLHGAVSHLYTPVSQTAAAPVTGNHIRILPHT